MIEFKVVKSGLLVSFCSSYDLYFNFNEEVIIHVGLFVIRVVAKEPSRSELVIYDNDEGLFVIKDGKEIKVRKKFRYNKNGLDVRISLFWEAGNED